MFNISLLCLLGFIIYVTIKSVYEIRKTKKDILKSKELIQQYKSKRNNWLKL